MKRLVVVLAGLLTLPAFAEVAPAYFYDDVVEYETTDDVGTVDEIAVESEQDVVTPAKKTSPRTVTSGRSATTRGNTGATTRGATARNSAGVTRGTVARATTARTATTTPASTPTRTTVSRAATTRAGTTGALTTRAATRRGTQSTGVTARAGSIIQSDTVNTPLYTGRVGVRRANISARMPAVRASTPTAAVSVTNTSTVTEETITEEDLDMLAQTTDFCKAQYTACMDNYCNILDSNQGRCSCSPNIKNYEKTEAALKQANIELQEVAQKIQYIGLSRAQVATLFEQTLAEMELASQGEDSTQLKNSLDSILDLVVDVKSGRASTSTVTTGMNVDLTGLMNFNIDSTGFDLSSLFGSTKSSNTNAITNQRGEQLYKTAAARCKAAVLTDCERKGVEISVITNGYDLEIDKQCLIYENNLTTANDNMAATIRNAKTVLQKARLMVAEQKNSLDFRNCVTELDNCMQDDFVCGDDYENCLDPSGKYIVNGSILIGSEPGALDSDQGIYKYWAYADDKLEGPSDDPDVNKFYCAKDDGKGNCTNYNEDAPYSPWQHQGSLAGYVDAQLVTEIEDLKDLHDVQDIAKFLQMKIGYVENGQTYGMCASILNQCQAYTYTDTGASATFQPGNDVIREYLQRTLVQIKTAQDNLIADHAEDCADDVVQCVTTNGYEDTQTTSPTNNIAIRACLPQIKTCRSVLDMKGEDKEIITWVHDLFKITDTEDCPDNSTKLSAEGTVSTVGTVGGNTTKWCQCHAGFKTTADGKCEAVTTE